MSREVICISVNQGAVNEKNVKMAQNIKTHKNEHVLRLRLLIGKTGSVES